MVGLRGLLDVGRGTGCDRGLPSSAVVAAAVLRPVSCVSWRIECDAVSEDRWPGWDALASHSRRLLLRLPSTLPPQLQPLQPTKSRQWRCWVYVGRNGLVQSQRLVATTWDDGHRVGATPVGMLSMSKLRCWPDHPRRVSYCPKYSRRWPMDGVIGVWELQAI
ncbi:hypothetical protein F5Y18DRAFT_52293 [Xylariaceae sp. FL1019]|nr:hypothetical protein F5Y18DRAFT_52293 [Xylariaceae sp. FL1019]